jgi:hypothetical protein
MVGSLEPGKNECTVQFVLRASAMRKQELMFAILKQLAAKETAITRENVPPARERAWCIGRCSELDRSDRPHLRMGSPPREQNDLQVQCA